MKDFWLDNLFEKLEVGGSLSLRSRDLLSKHVTFKEIQPRTIWLKQGDITDEIGFVLSGIFRTYCHNFGEEEITIEFTQKDDFVSIFKSFYAQIPSEYSVESEVASELAIITIEAWSIFEREIPNWKTSITHIHHRYLLRHNDFQREILNQEALTCYRCFCEKFPTIVHNVPLGHIASYLGITQSTLSRIRKKDFNQ